MDSSSDTMVVMYNLASDQNRDDFEQWLRDVDLPGYDLTDSLHDPVYYRAESTLEGDKPPFAYIVTIRSTGGSAVDEEMSGSEWRGFVADFESRTRDAVYITAKRIIG